MKKVEKEDKKVKDVKQVKEAKVTKKETKGKKKTSSIKLGEVFGGIVIVLILVIVVGCFYFFLRNNKADVVLKNNDYVSYNGGTLSLKEALEEFESTSFDGFMDVVNYKLVEEELDDDDKDEVSKNVDAAVEDLRNYYTSEEDLNYAITVYTTYKDIDEYKDKEIKKMESYSVYTKKYCEKEDIDESKCEKYADYYKLKALYDLRKDKKIDFKTKDSQKKYDEYIEKIEENLDKLKEEMEKQEEGYTNIVPVTYDELDELIKNKESFMAVVTQTGCGHCEAFLPVLNDVLAEKEMVAVQINITDYSDEERENLDKLLTFTGTPTSFFFKNGKLTGSPLEGNVGADQVKEAIDKAKIK